MSVVLPVIDGFAGVTVLSLFLIPLMKMNGLYLSNILNGVICLAVIIAFSWKARGAFPKNIRNLMAIPKSFGAAKTDKLDVTVRSISDVTNVSQQIIDFCSGLGIDRKYAFYAGLSMEEMAANIVQHGFTKDRKKVHSVDIRVIYSKDILTLRLRDDCRPFDPSDRAQMLSDEDLCRNVGIRLVFRLAQSVQYQNLLGLNVLTIKI